MKLNNLVLIFVSLLTISCKKDDGYFLTGRLLDVDTDSAIVGEKIELWREYQPGFAGTSLGEITEMRLETVETILGGYFFFSGDGYTDKDTWCIALGSLRLSNGQKWTYSYLGMGEGAKEDGSTNCKLNVGVIYKE